MHSDPLLMHIAIADRQAKVRADVRALRQDARADHTGKVRRQLGQALIALGHQIAGQAPANRSLPAQPALGGAGQR